VAEGRVVQLGKTVAFMEAALMDEGGTVLVRATASARVVPVGRLGG
jgi:acyl-coenzyme A thioesterase PaaI-like protein